MKSAAVFGMHLYLRPLERTDLTDEYLSWLNNKETSAYLLTSNMPLSRAGLEKYYEDSSHGH
jgi:hypothetical protein